MSESNGLDDIYKIIDDMQARLVELFDQFRELRIRLGQKPLNLESLLSTSDSTTTTEDTSGKVKIPESPDRVSKNDTPEKSLRSEAPSRTSDSPDMAFDVRVSRLLDPISHELTTGSSPAEVIAEYLQAAKDDLIMDDSKHDKVARDMDIVLKFLRARGRRGIRPEERDNIIRRIKRWKAHLSK